MSDNRKKVLRVDRSPMNAMRWCLELECGHEVWITSRKMPQRQTQDCHECGRAILAQKGLA